jgi:hypothetical protein
LFKDLIGYVLCSKKRRRTQLVLIQHHTKASLVSDLMDSGSRVDNSLRGNVARATPPDTDLIGLRLPVSGEVIACPAYASS